MTLYSAEMETDNQEVAVAAKNTFRVTKNCQLRGFWFWSRPQVICSYLGVLVAPTSRLHADPVTGYGVLSFCGG